jgi:hypothetical protein
MYSFNVHQHAMAKILKQGHPANAAAFAIAEQLRMLGIMLTSLCAMMPKQEHVLAFYPPFQNCQYQTAEMQLLAGKALES